MHNINKRHKVQKQLCIVTQRNFSQQNSRLKINSQSRRPYLNPEQIIRCSSTFQQFRHEQIKSTFQAKKKSFCQFVDHNQTDFNGAKKKNRTLHASLIVSYDNKISPIHLKPTHQRRVPNDHNNQNPKQKQLVSKPALQRGPRQNGSFQRNSRAVSEWINQFKSSLRIKNAKKPLIPKQFRIRTEANELKPLGFDCRPWTRRDKEEQEEANIHNI